MFFLSGKESSSNSSYWIEGISTQVISSNFSMSFYFNDKVRKDFTNSIKLQNQKISNLRKQFLQYNKNFKCTMDFSNVGAINKIPLAKQTQGTLTIGGSKIND